MRAQRPEPISRQSTRFESDYYGDIDPAARRSEKQARPHQPEPIALDLSQITMETQIRRPGGAKSAVGYSEQILSQFTDRVRDIQHIHIPRLATASILTLIRTKVSLTLYRCPISILSLRILLLDGIECQLFTAMVHPAGFLLLLMHPSILPLNHPILLCLPIEKM